VAEVARDFLVNVGGMKQGGRAVEECDEGNRQAGVAVRSAAKLRSKLAFDESKDGMSSLRAKAVAQSSEIRR